MPKLTMPVAAGLTLVLMVLLYLISIPQTLGAHPFWALKVVLIGTPIGLIYAVFFRFTSKSLAFRALATAIITVAVFFVTKSSGNQFAASYAEDQVAGTFWFLGWIGTSASISALLFTLLAR